MRRLATRIAKLEVLRLPPPPFVPGPQLQETIDMLIEHVRERSGAEPTPESMIKYLARPRAESECVPA